MRYYAGAAVVMGIGWMIWRLLSSLSSDAIAMLVGAVFMGLAMVPVCVLCAATSKRRNREDGAERDCGQSAPVVIVLGGSNSYQGQGWGQNALPIPQGYDKPRQQGRIVDSHATTDAWGGSWEER